MTQRQARTAIEQPKHFPHDIQGIPGRAPPAARVEWIVCGGWNDRAPPSARYLLPQRAHPARVGLRRDDDDRGSVLALQFRGSRSQFIRRVFYGRLEHADCRRWHPFVHQDTGVEEVFAEISDMHRLKRDCWFAWAR